jgi:cell division protein FtsQ
VSRPTTTKGTPTLTRPVTSAPANPPGSADVAGRVRFADRARAVRRASWRWKLGLPALVLLLAGSWWFVYSGPVLVLKDVAVPGVSSTMAEQVRTVAQLPTGQQMARLDLSAVQHRVAAIRTVRSVSVRRSWPTTVTIAVTLRTPVAVVKDGQGHLHLADSTGTAYADLTSAPGNLPMVNADATKPAAVQAVVRVLAALPEGVRAQVSAATAKGPDSVTLELGRATIVWGSAEDSSLKVTVLQALRRANPTARHFDLSAPRAPSVG